MIKNIKNKKTILIDLDGVLNNYQGIYNEENLPTIKEGAKEFLEKVSKDYIIKIFTTRTNLKVAKWVVENHLEKYITDITKVKEPAYLIIDDRVLKFNGKFDDLYNDILNFKVWYK